MTLAGVVFAAAIICLILIPRAQAQTIRGPEQQLIETLDVPLDQPEEAAPQTTELKLGAGPVVTSALDAGGHTKVYGVPLIFFRYKDYLSIDETQARLNLVPVDSAIGDVGLRAGPMLRVDFGHRIFASGVTGPGMVGTSLELGGFASYATGPARFRVQVRQDVTGGHKGMIAEFEAGTGLYRKGAFSLGAQFSAAWASQRYMQSFFGVTQPQSVASGLSVYMPGSGLKDVRSSLIAEYKLGGHWSSAMSLQYVRRIGDALHSPIVEARGSADRINTGVFALYSF